MEEKCQAELNCVCGSNDTPANGADGCWKPASDVKFPWALHGAEVKTNTDYALWKYWLHPANSAFLDHPDFSKHSYLKLSF